MKAIRSTSLLLALLAVTGCSGGKNGGGNARPDPLILEPHEESSHLPGDVDFEGEATDEEDGVLGPASMSWQILNEDGDVVGAFQGAAGTISLLVAGDYTAVLTAEDSKGKKRSVEHPFHIASTVGRILDPDNHDVLGIADPFEMTGRAETVAPGVFLTEIAFVGINLADDSEVFRLPVAVPGSVQQYEATVQPSLAAGRYRLRLEVTTNAPAESAEDNIRVLADAEPQVSILSPVDGSRIAPGTSIAFSATVTDEGGGTPTLEWISSIEGSLSNDLEFSSSSLGRAKHRITLVATDENGLRGTDSVEVYIEEAGTPLFADVSGLPDPDVLSLAVNPGTPDAIWAGTAAGIARIAADTGAVGASHTAAYNDNGTGAAGAAACIGGGECLFGFEGGLGVSIRDAGDTAWTTFDTGLTDLVVNDIAQSPVDDALFFATQQGLTQTDASRANPVAHDQNDLATEILSVAVGADGVVWAGTADVGLVRLTLPSSQALFDEDDGLGSNVVTAVVVDGDGIVWAGTDQGLSRLDPSTNEIDTFRGPLPDEHVLSLAVDGDVLWVGTIDGAARYDMAQELWTTFDDTDLVGQRVNAIAVDTDGAVWFGIGDGGNSTGGVTRYDGP